MAMSSPMTDPAAPRPASGVISPRHVRSRTQSISSDRPSTIGLGLGLTAPPLDVSPQPAFIAASAASQIVTNDHDSHADAWYDQNGIEPAGETALVNPEALHLVNGFLDQMLFNFLQASKSTALSALRPAVCEILKPKLAKDTIANADEELREYLGGADEEEYERPAGSAARDWDVELVWKRTRLRCMVYSSLGDLEEEDEDLYMEQENLQIGDHEHLADAISPAVAIFLTSVLEYMGELTLTVAGQAAYQRVRAKIERDIKDGVRDPSATADRVVVGEMDMERVALDRTLGRLWRGWKKRMRFPALDMAGRPFSRGSNGHGRPDIGFADGFAARSAAMSDAGSEMRRSQDYGGSTIAEDVQPMDIPLPIGDNDVDEIEVPGLAHNSDDDEPESVTLRGKLSPPRPRSLSIKQFIIANGLPTPTVSQPDTPVITTRKRSSSLPTPVLSTFYASRQASKATAATGVEGAGGGDEVASDVAAAGNTAASSAAGEEAIESRSRAAASPVAEQADRRHDMETANSHVTGASDIAQAKDSDSSDYEEAREITKYEKAKILTSSRVSITGSPRSSVSGKNSPRQRSSSARSARIVDVSGPRSPSHSRPTSVETAEHRRPASLSGVASLALSSSGRDGRKAGEGENAVATPGIVPLGPSMAKSPEQEAASMSGRAGDSAKGPAALVEPYGLVRPADAVPAVFGGVGLFPSAHEEHMASSASGWKPSPPVVRRDSAPAIIRVGNSKGSGSSGPFIDGSIPEIPQMSPGHSGRHSPKADGRGIVPTERSRAGDTDDEPALPSQTNITPRQIHTSASSNSSGTSRLKPVRTSEESSSRAESMARNFEELIQSNQTITYTLTPENMRDIDSKRTIDGPVVTRYHRKNDDARSSPTALDAAKPSLTQRPEAPGSPRAAESKGRRASGSAAPGLAIATGRAAGPRDARVPRDSTTDFADFIKSTGPSGDRGATHKAGMTTSPTASSMDSRRVSTTSNRSRFQPRDAAVDHKADNSDLIDFIRQGPPIATSGHRIPRHVAPFRSTMDSDQMAGAIGGKAVDAIIPEIRYSQASTNMTDNSMPSMQSSINSSSALIKNKGAAPAAAHVLDDEGMMPQRKQRRVRDPYATDFTDDEDEEEMVETPRLPVKKEESLAEFLRNYDPPPEPPSPPRPPKKKTSAPSLIGRFTRSSNKDSKDFALPSSPSRSLSSRGGKGGYIPIQVNVSASPDHYGSADGFAGRSRLASAAPSGRVPMKKFEPREAVSTARSGTADLAAFLRDSAPPESPIEGPATRAPPRQDEGSSGSSSISKMFGRRKKASLT